MSNTLKASELRIGNLVFQHGEPVEICQLDRGGHTFWQINDMRIHKETGREQNTHEFILQPIPLTEEWLVMFGFEYNHDTPHPNKVFRKHHSDGFIDLEKIISFFYGGHFTSVQIKHVHQLQNLYFALTGEELTIKQ